MLQEQVPIENNNRINDEITNIQLNMWRKFSRKQENGNYRKKELILGTTEG